jgi:hypothetical protein
VGWVPRPKLNRTAAEQTLKAINLGPEHEALATMVKGLAAAVDASPDDAGLWREYRMGLALLEEAARSDDSDSASADSVAFLRAVQTPMGDLEVR